jgi:hypothetical protein
MKKLTVVPALLKAHVSAFTRKDGTYVAEHDDKRQGAAPAAPKVQTRNEGYGFHGEAYQHHLRETVGGEDYFTDAKEKDHVDARAAADTKFSNTAHQLVQAGHFNNHDDARDYLDSRSGRHLHDEAPDGDISKVGWIAKDVKNQKALGEYAASNKAKAAAPKPAPERKQAAGYVAPKDGDTGSDEHKKYGVYFRRGDKVKDASGDQHEVIQHNGAEVLTNHGTFHPSKITHAGAGMQKSMLLVSADLMKAHVQGYTRKDGVFVKEHDDQRQAAAPKQKALPDGHDFHAHLGSMEDGGTQHFANSKFPAEKVSVKRSGDRFHMIHKNPFKTESKEGMSQSEMADRLSKLHSPSGLYAGERLMDAGSDKPAAAKKSKPTGSAAPAKMVNTGSAKWPMQTKASEKLPKAHEDGSTHHVGGFKPPEYPAGGGATDGDVSVHHDGRTYHFTGKKGTDMKTGEMAYEYGHRDDQFDRRAWVSKSGHLKED